MQGSMCRGPLSVLGHLRDCWNQGLGRPGLLTCPMKIGDPGRWGAHLGKHKTRTGCLGLQAGGLYITPPRVT